MLKGISRFFGTTFLSLGFTLLLLSVFALGLYNGLDEFKTGLPGVVKDSIREYGYENLLNDNEQLRQVDEYCRGNAEMQDCKELELLKKDPGLLVEREEFKPQIEQFNLQLENAVDAARAYEDKVKLARIVAIALLVLGGLLIYFASFELLIAGRTIGFSLMFSGLVSFLLYEYGIPYGADAAEGLIAEQTAQASGLMKVIIENGYEYILGFLQTGLNKVAMLSLWIGIFGALSGLGCWILKMQKFKKEETRK